MNEASICLDLRGQREERTLIFRALVAENAVRDTLQCGQRTIVEIDITAKATRFKQKRVKREIRLWATITDVDQGVVMQTRTERVVLTDSLDFVQVKDVVGPGQLAFNRVESKTLSRTIFEPLLIATAVFTSVYLLFTVRS